MRARQLRDAVSIPTIPRPRQAESAPVAPPEPTVPPEAAPRRPEGRYPWPEPWGSFRGARPRTEYWDVATASWRSRGPRPPAGH